MALLVQCVSGVFVGDDNMGEQKRARRRNKSNGPTKQKHHSIKEGIRNQRITFACAPISNSNGHLVRPQLWCCNLNFPPIPLAALNPSPPLRPRRANHRELAEPCPSFKYSRGSSLRISLPRKSFSTLLTLLQPCCRVVIVITSNISTFSY
jgi:hypothetical protein